MPGPVDERATRRNNYPVTVTLPPVRPAAQLPAGARVNRGTPAPTMGDTIASYTRAAFPATTRAIRSSNADAGAAYARGDTLGAVGASARKIPTGVAGLAYDVSVPALTGIWDGGKRLLGGLLGSDGSTTVNRAFTPPAPAAAASPAANPVDAAMVAGRQAMTTPLSPQEKMLAHLDTLLSRPMTQRGMQAVSGSLSQTLGNTPRAASTKDTVLDRTAEISQATYDNEVKRIMEARASGAMNLEQAREATGKATDAYFLRNTALVGNPLSYAQANMLPSPDDTEE